MAKSLRQHRHKARVLAMQALFQLDARGLPTERASEVLSFNWMDYAVPEEERAYAREVIEATLANLATIDEAIKARLVNWELERISPVSRAILRIAVAELEHLVKKTDAPVVIDEAILLAKKYDAPEAGSFINALLDSLVRGDGETRPAPKLAEKIKIKKSSKSKI